MSKASELASLHGLTLGHLHDQGGRELEHILERYDALAARLAEAERLLRDLKQCNPHLFPLLRYRVQTFLRAADNARVTEGKSDV